MEFGEHMVTMCPLVHVPSCTQYLCPLVPNINIINISMNLAISYLWIEDFYVRISNFINTYTSVLFIFRLEFSKLSTPGAKVESFMMKCFETKIVKHRVALSI